MDDTLKVTDTYWEMLKSLSDDIKLRLATPYGFCRSRKSHT